MAHVSGIGPVRITSYKGKQMVEAWSEREDGRWDASLGYVRAGSLGLTLDEMAAAAYEVNTTMIYRGEWQVDDEGFTVKVLGPHPDVPFPGEPTSCTTCVCCRGDH